MSFNHHPSQIGIWFDYTGGRYKDSYDIELDNGVILQAMYPNGCGWSDMLQANVYKEPEQQANTYVRENESSIRDDQVVKLRLTPDEDLLRLAKFSCMVSTGQGRIDWQCELFAEYLPELDENGVVIPC
jgi:hypothetical protein